MDVCRMPVRMKALFAALLLLVLSHLLPAPLSHAQEASLVLEEAVLTVDGEEAELKAPLRMRDDRLYVPVASVGALFGASVAWDQDNQEVTVHTADGHEIVLGIGVPVVYYDGGRYVMETVPFLEDGRTYLPLRHVADLLRARVAWDKEAQVAALTRIDGDDHVPALLAHEAEPYSEEDFWLLAKITMVEAGYEGYEGQLAVANVILNRVKDDRFPDTIRDVIYAGKQFPPAHNGLLDKSEPNESVLKAVKDALNGKNNVADALYFHNPKVSGGKFWSSLDVVTTIGNHRFYK